jgi:tetratricopeptide (TPR) repeat protein
MRRPAARGLLLSMMVLIVLAGAASPQAPQANALVGKRVVTREGTVLRAGKEVVDDEKREKTSRGTERRDARIYRVQQVNGDLVYLVSESDPARGWVASKQVQTLEQAVAGLTRAIQANPNDSFALVDRGTVLANLGRIDEALADYSRAIEVQPRNEVALLNRGNLWLARREPQQAISDYSRAIQVDRAYTVAYLNRGRAWMMLDELDKAVADFTKVIELDPQGASGYLFRGSARLRARELDEALPDFDKAIELDAKDPLAHYNRGLVRMAKGDPAGAIEDFGEVIKLDPRNADAFIQRGTARRNLREYEAAIADFEQALVLRPNDPHTFNNRGNAHAARQEFDLAQADYARAINLDPGYAAAHYNTAVVDLITRDPRAIAEGRKVAELERRAPALAPYALLVSYLAARRAGQEDEAKASLELAGRSVRPNVWPAPLVDCFAGKVDAKALLDAAQDEDQRTIARGFLGYDSLIKGDTNGAREHFTWVIDHGNRGYAQYIMAQAELAKLDAK